MVVLSLFDGMSCGQIALKELGIVPDKYYASEIDKYAISQTQFNFPNTIHLGSVTDVEVSELAPIDLLIGGSPCQSFSFAGKRAGMSTKDNVEIYTLRKYLELKEQGFEFEGQSYLFWEYIRILTDIRKYNPRVAFLLENVEMGSKWERILSEAIGIFGVHINSALVSAQNRRRIYWTNIRTREEGLFGELYTDIPQPVDKGLFLRDVLEPDVEDKYYIKQKNMYDFVTDEWRLNKSYTQIDGLKSLPLMARVYASWCGDYITGQCVSLPANMNSGRANVSNLIKTNNVTRLNERQKKNHKSTDSKADAFLSTSYKGSQANGMTLVGDQEIRRLTPLECARLQTVPDWYKWACSDTQIYRLLGNGWTVQVICHILKFLNNGKEN